MSRNQVSALLWVAGVGAVIVLIVGGALWVRQDVADGPDERMSAGEIADQLLASSVAVRYCFEGSANSVDITMVNDQGNTEQLSNRRNGQCLDIGRVPRGQRVYLSAQNNDRSGSVTCRIMGDGRVIERARSEGRYVVVSCSGVA